MLRWLLLRELSWLDIQHIWLFPLPLLSPFPYLLLLLRLTAVCV